VTRIPPLQVRRVTITPLVLVIDVLFIAVSPLLTAIAAALSPLAGGRRPLRLLTIALTYAVGHVAAVAACALLWASGRGGEHGPHYAVLRWFIGGVARAALRVARVKIRMHGSVGLFSRSEEAASWTSTTCPPASSGEPGRMPLPGRCAALR